MLITENDTDECHYNTFFIIHILHNIINIAAKCLLFVIKMLSTTEKP